ncbi:alpha/beta hydrolase family protein [Cyclobacterium xiamenense]|uniref:alpha/beta hydrolase family protein n=1 Tax=Cyclobacterium xiamenense TaxID=1297121 RepID=UPI0012B996B2|nr:acetylxylan esterase [Cyclobacterium xiamenense]
MKYVSLTLLFVLLLSTVGLGQEDLKVIQPQWVNFTDGPNALYKYQAAQAFELLHAREEAVAQLQTLDDWKEWQKQVKAKLMEVVGPFPEKTPLHPEITRTVQKPGYRMDHLVFQSQPGFYLSGTLFIPDGLPGKAPAIVYCSGHALEAYRSVTYQHVILNLVKKGFIVFAFDPVGQGERLEYFDSKTGKPTIGGPTKQHSYPGAQAFIAGSSQAKYMIWDGIRAVDYLISRPEVDRERIGITGRSGGGTQASYIAAFDERIHASAPENYLTNFKRLWLTHGPQDAEQNFYRGISSGLDQPDLVLVRAPKPNLLIATTRDIFNIEGARETENQLSRIYAAYGKPENVEMVEDDAGHASTKSNREAMYAFFQKHLRYPGKPLDEPIDTLTQAELRVSPTGQLLDTYPGKTIHELSKELAVDGPEGSLSERVASSRELSGYREPAPVVDRMMTGRYQRDGYTVEKHLVKGEGGYWLPFLLFRPNEGSTEAVLYLHPEGKAADAAVGGEIEALVRQGATVLAPDLLNTGEMGDGAFNGDSNFGGNSYNHWFGSILIGRSLVGLHAGDANRLVQVLQETSGKENIRGVAKGAMSAVLLHAANYSDAYQSIALIDPMISYRELVERKEYDPSLIAYSVANALPYYDLPDLLENLVDRNPLVIQGTFGSPSESRSLLPERGHLEKINYVQTEDPEARKAYLKQWLQP